MNKKKSLSIIIIIALIFSPILSFADDYIEADIFDLSLPASYNLSDIPTINARHAVVIDRSSKTVLFGKLETETCKMASTTKIMTAIVVLENCSDLNDIVTVSKKSARYRRFEAWTFHK